MSGEMTMQKNDDAFTAKGDRFRKKSIQLDPKEILHSKKDGFKKSNFRPWDLLEELERREASNKTELKGDVDVDIQTTDP
jgi:hypothetical protein